MLYQRCGGALCSCWVGSLDALDQKYALLYMMEQKERSPAALLLPHSEASVPPPLSPPLSRRRRSTSAAVGRWRGSDDRHWSMRSATPWQGLIGIIRNSGRNAPCTATMPQCTSEHLAQWHQRLPAVPAHLRAVVGHLRQLPLASFHNDLPGRQLNQQQAQAAAGKKAQPIRWVL